MNHAPTLDPEILVRISPASFAAFASRGAWKPYPYLTYIANLIADAHDPAKFPRGGRLIFNMAPRHGKSELLSKWLPIWLLDRDPYHKVICCSHGAELAESFGRVVRNEFANNGMLWTTLRDDSKAANRWNTPEGGGMVTGGVGTGITGFGGDTLILDDPYGTTADARSATYHRKLTEWFKATFRMRLEPNGTIIVCHHRWGTGDLTDWLLSQPHDGVPWKLIRLPGLAEPGDPLGRAPGEALCPDRYDAQALLAMQAADKSTFAAMIQQAPTEGGAGAVYDTFDAACLDPDADAFSPSLPLALCFDYNINPGMHGLIGQYDPRQDVFRVGHEIHEERMSLAASLDAFVQWVHRQGGWKWGPLQVYGDASGRASSIITGESSYDRIRARLTAAGIKFTICVPASNPPVADRVAAVNDALKDATGTRRMFVHPRCERLITDFRKMTMDEYGDINKTQRRISHASDALGYWVYEVRPVGGRLTMPPGRFGV